MGTPDRWKLGLSGGRDDSGRRVPIGTWLHKALPQSRPQKAFMASTYKAGPTTGGLKGNP